MYLDIFFRNQTYQFEPDRHLNCDSMSTKLANIEDNRIYFRLNHSFTFVLELVILVKSRAR